MCVSLIGRTMCYGHVNISSNLVHTYILSDVIFFYKLILPLNLIFVLVKI